MNNKSKLIAMLIVALSPAMAHANAGTPLMWASMFHLVIGNAIIGIIEGLLLSSIFKVPRKKSIWVLIVANYISAWAGGLLVSWKFSKISDVTILNIEYWFWLFVLIAFIITLIIEFPFFWAVLRKQPKPITRSLKATVLIHGISYLLLFGWYWSSSGTSMMTKLDVISGDEFQLETKYDLYFITTDGNRVIKADLAGNTQEVICEVDAKHRNDRLFVRQDEEGKFDLFICLDLDKRGDIREESIISDFSSFAPIDWKIVDDSSQKPEGNWFNFGLVPSISSSSEWEYWSGMWAIEGIQGWKKDDDARFCFSLEIPIRDWIVRNGTHLDGDYVVFQLGDDQICILHPLERKIALIARGKGPIVAKSKSDSSTN